MVSTISPSQQPRVLIIEEQEVVSLVIAHILESNGFDVDIRKSGSDALRGAIELKPDYIVSSLQLPDMAGSDAVRTILENESCRDAKPLFFSSSSGRITSEETRSITINGRDHPNLSRNCVRGSLLDALGEL